MNEETAYSMFLLYLTIHLTSTLKCLHITQKYKNKQLQTTVWHTGLTKYMWSEIP